MIKFHIKLTTEEQELVSRIDLRSNHDTHEEGHAAFLANRAPILALLDLLDSRNAIPPHRLSYWTDPAYNLSGRIRASRMGLFERNDCTGDDIYTHPSFLKHLRYFLYGVELPPDVVSEFEAKVGEPRWVSLSDGVPLGKVARDITRRGGLAPYSTAEEFFKLCLDLGLSVDVADAVYRAVRRLR